jgi:hypothetical protein
MVQVWFRYGAAKRYLIASHVAAKAVQLQQLLRRVVMTVQKRRPTCFSTDSIAR